MMVPLLSRDLVPQETGTALQQGKSAPQLTKAA